MKGDRTVYVTVGFSVIFPDSTDCDAEVQAEYILDQVKHLIKSYQELKEIEEERISVEEENDDEDNTYDEERDDDMYATIYWLPSERKAEAKRRKS